MKFKNLISLIDESPAPIKSLSDDAQLASFERLQKNFSDEKHQKCWNKLNVGGKEYCVWFKKESINSYAILWENQIVGGLRGREDNNNFIIYYTVQKKEHKGIVRNLLEYLLNNFYESIISDYELTEYGMGMWLKFFHDNIYQIYIMQDNNLIPVENVDMMKEYYIRGQNQEGRNSRFVLKAK